MSSLCVVEQDAEQVKLTESRPKTYRAAQFSEKGGKLEIVEKQIEQPKDGHILIKTLACGVCHSDSIACYDMFGGGLPRVPGHEIVGEVAAVPESEKKWKVGDRVASGWHGHHCHSCERCELGDYKTCKNELINGVSRDGGYSEYVDLCTESVISVPKDADPVEIAPLLCAGLTTFNGIREVEGTSPGDLVAIQGIGGLGHLGIQFAKKMGFVVAALSTSESKRELATKLGADHYIVGDAETQAQKLKELGGAKLIAVTAPHAKAVAPLLGGLAIRGTLLLLAAIPDPIPFNTMQMIAGNLSIKAHAAGAPTDARDAVQFAQNKGVKCMSEAFSLDDAQKAYQSMMDGKPRFRAVIKF